MAMVEPCRNFGEAGQVAIGQSQRFGDAAGRIGGRGRCLRCDDTSVDAADEVGERTAYIDTDIVHEAWTPDAGKAAAARLPGVRRRSARRTTKLKQSAIAASVPISANKAAGL